MFTLAKLRNGSTYLANHLTANDYYAEGEAVTGEWIGQGAELLGIRGEKITARNQAFDRLRRNLHPVTGKKLTARLGAGRIVYLDFQCSAPKSVSLLAVTFGDERLRQAHQDAVTVAFAELERFAARRVRGGGAAWSEQTAITGNLCAARFEHDASRALDAQLHTHLVTANATFDAQAGKWFALTEREMLSAVRYAGKVYQNELARRVLAAGYWIDSIRDAKGEVEGFEIEGVSPEDRAVASQRRAQIEQGIAAFRKKHGREPTTREVHRITTESRPEKLAEITTPEVRRLQRKRFTGSRVAALDSLVLTARRRRPLSRFGADETRAFTIARDHLFERSSVQRGHQLLAEALNINLGCLSLDALKARLAQQADDCIRLAGSDPLQALYATKTGLRYELGVVDFVNAGRQACATLGRPDFSLDTRLSLDQRQAVSQILGSADQVCALRGVAGAGKTFALREVQRGLRAAGRAVFVCAPTTSAAAVLRNEGLAYVNTLSHFLLHGQNPPHGAGLRGGVIIVDEAGIANTRQGAELCEIARRQGARVLLVGDTRQHSGVEAGDFLSVLERHSRLQTCELTDIRRQTRQSYRAAVKLMAQGHAHSGLKALDQQGWLHEAGGDYIKRAAHHYAGCVTTKRDAILVAPTWDEIHRLTDAVRDELKKRRLLGASQPATVAEPLNWTKAQAARTPNYRPGYWLTFHQAIRSAGVASGSTVEVTAVKRGKVRVRDAQGTEFTLAPTRQSAAWTVSAPRAIELAPGDHVLIRQNHRAAGLVNGEVLKIETRHPSGAWTARDDQGAVREIPATFRAFTHGYAVTSHKAQGRTTDEVIVCAAKLDAKAAYVAFSRARQQATGYTPDKAALFDGLPSTNEPRLAALDLWTHARRARLVWARNVIKRVRSLFMPFVPPLRLTVPLPRVDPIPRPHHDESDNETPRAWASDQSPREDQRPSVRTSM